MAGNGKGLHMQCSKGNLTLKGMRWSAGLSKGRSTLPLPFLLSHTKKKDSCSVSG